MKCFRPQCDIDRSDTEEDLYSSCEEDPYFNSLVDDFIGAVTSTDLLASSPEIDYMAANQSQSLFYAESALKHYNNNDENKVTFLHFFCCIFYLCTNLAARNLFRFVSYLMLWWLALSILVMALSFICSYLQLFPAIIRLTLKLKVVVGRWNLIQF